MISDKMLDKYRQIIQQETSRHLRQYGGEQNEIIQEAYLAALSTGDRITELGFVRLFIRSRLIDRRRREIIRRHVELERDMENYQEDDQFSIESFLQELSDDARYVLSLILDPDPDFYRPPITASCRETWLTILRNRLRAAEWSVGRITDAFTCIRQALS